MRQTLKMPAAQGVAAGQTATFKLPIKSRYHMLYLVYSGVTLAQMTEIRVIANSKPFQRFTAEDLDKMNQQKGLAAASGILVLMLDRFNLKTRAMEEDTAVNTGSVDPNTGKVITEFNIEIDIAGAASGPALSLFADISQQLPGGPGTLLYINKFTRAASGAGELDVADMPYGGITTQLLNAVYIKKASGAGDITGVKIDRDLYNIFDRSVALNTLIRGLNKRVVVADWFTYDRTERGYGLDPVDLKGVRDFRYKVTTDDAASLVFYQETIGALGD